MPTLPDMNRIPRVVLIEEKLRAARPILAHLANAGLDCRYLPLEAAGNTAIQEINPHIILVSALGDTASEAAARRLCQQIRQFSNVPILVLAAGHADLGPWREMKLGVGYIFQCEGLPQACLERVAERLESIYHETALLQVAEEKTGATSSRQPPRQGWHTCHACGYLGPREKFINPDRHSGHALKCPACHSTDSIEFSMSANG